MTRTRCTSCDGIYLPGHDEFGLVVMVVKPEDCSMLRALAESLVVAWDSQRLQLIQQNHVLAVMDIGYSHVF